MPPLLAVRIFLQQPLEPALQHLFHHPEIITRRQVIAANIKLAILVLGKPFRPRHNHRPNRMRALNVAVVVNLDPPRRCVQPKCLRNPSEQLCLCCRLGHLARQALTRIARCRFHQLGLLTALRHHQFDLAPPRLLAQCVRHQVGVVDRVRQQQKPGRLLAIVKLADKRLQNFRRLDPFAHTRIEITVAPQF